MMPYRLEMGTRFQNARGKDLYKFWGEKLSISLTNELKNHDQKIIINCASVEYFKSIKNSQLDAKIITPIFKEIKLGKPKIISFFAKKARGMMARFIIQNKINDENELKYFNFDGYQYNQELSSSSEPVFTRFKA